MPKNRYSSGPARGNTQHSTIQLKAPRGSGLVSSAWQEATAEHATCSPSISAPLTNTRVIGPTDPDATGDRDEPVAVSLGLFAQPNALATTVPMCACAALSTATGCGESVR